MSSERTTQGILKRTVSMRSHNHRTKVNVHAWTEFRRIWENYTGNLTLLRKWNFYQRKGKVRSDKKTLLRLNYSEDFLNDGLMGNYAFVHYQKWLMMPQCDTRRRKHFKGNQSRLNLTLKFCINFSKNVCPSPIPVAIEICFGFVIVGDDHEQKSWSHKLKEVNHLVGCKRVLP